ncbi:MAG: thiamine pyrophosphate-dependent enzyme [Planctomycetota bacterium]
MALLDTTIYAVAMNDGGNWDPADDVVRLRALRAMDGQPLWQSPPLEAGDSVSFGSIAGPTIDPAAEDAVRTAIDRAERPAVIAGTLAIRRGWHDWLNGLGVPVFSTAAAKGVVDETRPHAAGVYTGVGQPLSPEAVLLQDADLVIGLGLRHSEVLSAAALPCPAVNIDCAGPEHWNGFGFTAVAAPSDALVDQLRACLSDRQPDGTAERIAGCRTAMLTRLRGEAFLPAQAFEALSSTLPDAGFVMDTGLYCTVGEHVLQARTPQTCLLAGQSRYMGTGIPMALGAAAVAPDRPTVAIVGDGGIAMAVGELKLAVELELPLLVVLMSDGNLGTLRPRARKDGLTEAPMRIDQPSWRAVLDGMGIPGAAAATGQELADALAGIGPIKAPRYLELTFDPDHYITMCDGVR